MKQARPNTLNTHTPVGRGRGACEQTRSWRFQISEDSCEVWRARLDRLLLNHYLPPSPIPTPFIEWRTPPFFFKDTPPLSWSVTNNALQVTHEHARSSSNVSSNCALFVTLYLNFRHTCEAFFDSTVVFDNQIQLCCFTIWRWVLAFLTCRCFLWGFCLPGLELFDTSDREAFKYSFGVRFL